MKILQVNKFFYRRGGAETHFFDLIDLLGSHGHEVISWSMKDPANKPSEYEKYFIDNIDFQKKESWVRQAQKAGHILYSIEAARKLDKLLSDTKPDIAHLHNIYHHFSPSIFSVFKKHKVPVVETLHDYKLINPNYRLFNRHGICLCGKNHKYYQAIFKRCVDDSFMHSMAGAIELSFHKLFKFYERGVARFITPSDFMRKLMIEWGEPAEKFVTFNNFLNPEWYNVAYGVRGSRVSNHGKYFLYIGRLSSEKGILSLIAAARTLTNIPLKILGAGSLEDSIRRQIKNTPQIELVGFAEGEKLYSLVEGARAVVAPSEWFENYPMVIIEAMSKGRPVIASAIGGIPEIVKDGVNGWLFKPGDTRALRALLEKVWALPPREWDKVSQAAFEQIRENNNPEEYYNKLMGVYEQSCNNNFSEHG